ncbi:hypothetical protein [Candidatus Lariskella endosymbiont of Epinotia ramella]|uniref:hypothetical protein n=1 Tax=Candidatus Lariskella endosymbiont of Epinotia ramella TaxID=3066224 RepID=UPI0030D1810D
MLSLIKSRILINLYGYARGLLSIDSIRFKASLHTVSKTCIHLFITQSSNL